MIFFNKARVTKNNGCYFYDQDIITADYLYSGDCRIELQLKYVNSGFGILLIQDAEDIFKSPKQYMFKLGDNEYSVIDKIVDLLGASTQTIQEYSTVQFKHLINNDDAILVLEKINNEINFYLKTKKEKVVFIEKFKIDIDDYKIGFYSQYGNTIKSIKISTGLPIGWAANSISTVGGRIYYYDNTIQFENCTYEAETETDFISLKKGTYFLKADIEGDIIAYVFESNSDSTDINKKELLNGNKIVLEKDADISIRFAGRNGTVKNISLQEYENSEYVPSSGSGSKQEGSYLHFDLDNISRIELVINIQKLPIADKLKYYYFKYDGREYTPELPLNEDVRIVYDRKSLTIAYPGGYVHLNKYSSRYLDMFYNIDAYVSKLLITNKENKTEDILNVSEFISYVTDEVTSPILCLDKDDEPLDLSSSYREIIIPSTQIEMFNRYTPINLSKKLNVYELEDIKVVGIKEFTEINPSAKTLDKFILSDVGYVYLDFNHNTDVDIKHNSITISNEIRKQYKYIIIVYPHAEEYMYRFTNWNREVFSNTKKELKLAKPILDTFNNIIVYATNDEVDEKYFYRVRKEKETTDVKMAVTNYDVLDNSQFDIDFKRNEIVLHNNNYKHYIIEYLKADSYCINDLKYNVLIGKEASNLYEVKVSSNKKDIKIIYDQNKETKAIDQYRITDLNMTPNEYVVMR